MIIKKSEIINVSLELFGESLDSSILEKQTNGNFEHTIPFRFKYNGSWHVNHKCENCDEICEFGLNFDSSKSPYSSLSFEKTEYLCSKFYDYIFLEMISNIFHSTSIIVNEVGSFLVFENLFESDFPVSSSIQPIFYSCKKCNVEYLGLMRNQFPYSPDKGCTEGIIGSVFIDELVRIEVANNQKFIELLRHFRKQ
jgi:hypothetical protein